MPIYEFIVDTERIFLYNINEFPFYKTIEILLCAKASASRGCFCVLHPLHTSRHTSSGRQSMCVSVF